jgi:predicted RNase H-like HicB family nuclease
VIGVAIEATPKKAFATAVDWPGWSRSGKTPELALEALAEYAPRYAAVAREAGEPFPTVPVELDAFEVVEEAAGGGGTAFGVPSRVTDADRRPTTPAEAARLRQLVAAAWTILGRVAAAAPAELRKGPRGGGRDRDRMLEHVIEADAAYAREIGLRLKAPAPGDRAAVEAARTAVLEAIGTPSDGSPLADRKWTARYAAGRIAWHALDHAWEMEDRTDPS